MDRRLDDTAICIASYTDTLLKQCKYVKASEKTEKKNEIVRHS